MYLNGICFITDRSYSPLSLEEMVRAVLEAGISFIQYREKEQSRSRIFAQAVLLRAITREFKAALIVNDHADIACAADADGVHLGQDDLPLKEARRIMGSRIIGISTHTLKQARDAAAAGADYIGVGPIFHTTTKDAGPPKGVDFIPIIKQNVHIPVVAIGGISLGNITAVMDVGADAAAVATAICRGDLSQNARMFVEIIRKRSGVSGIRPAD